MPAGERRGAEASGLDCLVVGAGISGLLAARTLRAAGRTVVVLDKARGVGGRMASRRFGDARFDHGAQFFTCRSRAFADVVGQWRGAGAAVEWCRGFSPGGDGHPRYRGVPAMTAGPKRLAAALDVHTSSRVVRLVAGGGAWRAHCAEGPSLAARCVVLTAPVPQSLALLDAGPASLAGDLRDELEAVAYAPCLALMAVLSRPSGMRPPGGLQIDEGLLRWIGDNQRKGISELPALTLHGAQAFSRDHFDSADDEIAALMFDAATEHGALGGADVEQMQLHRWRYAEPTRGVAERCLAARDPAPIVFCGDAFGEPRVEGAALSGLAAGQRAVELLAERRLS